MKYIFSDFNVMFFTICDVAVVLDVIFQTLQGGFYLNEVNSNFVSSIFFILMMSFLLT